MGKRKRHGADLMLLGAILVLLTIGLLMVFSASSIEAMLPKNGNPGEFGNPLAFFYRQSVAAGIGLVLMFAILRQDYRKLIGWKKIIFSATIILLVLVLIAGESRNGNKAWLGAGGFSLQPSEMAKLSLVIMLAAYFEREERLVKRGKKRKISYVPAIIQVVLILVLVGLEGDAGSAGVICLIAAVVLFAAGIPWAWIGALAAVLVPVAVLAVTTVGYRLKRFTVFLDPFQDPLGYGFQQAQALLAIGSGGLLGVGLGDGKSKYLWLPEQHNDFIFAVLAEEMGFIGGIIVFTLFAIVLYRVYEISKKAPDTFGRLLVTGMGAVLLVEALVNLAMVLDVFPVVGVTLPFISYGGSSLLFKLIAAGIILNVSRYTVEEENEGQELAVS
ncbi:MULTISPECIES: putative lipid II flippase FtsW [Carboxydocella]|uniref:Probable peptidoglycan glycosyltransferase FtsW n=2 Tax=Carboxydocella TaxID=178898 RepID=A0A1T4M8W5_9FIRM|nr:MULTISPECIES: putative lipid II flippase FtsW [Carboxydocella]AVX20991.1 cell division-specific peptidoglycan biosynthesis regulator FtsW [Carboxydocella thermautotrophica]AVX31409.1 cell division-specific peptidoglycan biosynthesis regulator FtsW [Carboxydocella thermautotrophica]SJZ63480.1 cell division protein FtsW [Carboxydocella sporoproducens DSM 16521]GAW28132.1 stage V sporulation protein E [Carboxydocella sp. ULO1]GAW30995.1 stage V sporulation protein E [Carboxydocella sp. JDF658]